MAGGHAAFLVEHGLSSRPDDLSFKFEHESFLYIHDDLYQSAVLWKTSVVDASEPGLLRDLDC